MVALIPDVRHPAPGIYRDVPDHEYRSWRLPSSTVLKVLAAKTPAHAALAASKPRDSKAMRIGSAVHALILQPHRYPNLFAVAPDVDRRTKAGKEAWESFSADAAGRTVLTADEDFNAREIAARATGHRLFAGALKTCTDRELSIVERIDGHLCKVRLDAVGGGVLVDIKTAMDASRTAFERAIANLGYGIQAALYWRAATAAGLDVRDFLWCVVENEEPYGCAVYRMDDEVVSLFAGRLEPLLALWHKCEREQRWPGYDEVVTDIGIPPWMRRQMEEGVEVE